MPKRLAPITPGEILKEEFIVRYGLSASKLSREIDVPHNRILEIIAGERAITADTALRLGRYFGTGPELWMNLQSHHELEKARRELEPAIRRRVRPIRQAPDQPRRGRVLDDAGRTILALATLRQARSASQESL